MNQNFRSDEEVQLYDDCRLDVCLVKSLGMLCKELLVLISGPLTKLLSGFPQPIVHSLFRTSQHDVSLVFFPIEEHAVNLFVSKPPDQADISLPSIFLDPAQAPNRIRFPLSVLVSSASLWHPRRPRDGTQRYITNEISN